MRWERFLKQISSFPVIAPSRFPERQDGLRGMRSQLSRWAAAGKLVPLAKGVYVLAPFYRKIDPHPFVVANAIKRNSYVSMQSAMAHHGMFAYDLDLEEVTCVTQGRPGRNINEFGSFEFQHVMQELYSDFTRIEVAPNQHAFIATPEKCLFDYVYLNPGTRPLSLRWIRGLQHLEMVSRERLSEMAAAYKKPRLKKIAMNLQCKVRSQVDRQRRWRARQLRIRREMPELFQEFE